jgi:hypothetical protein
VSIGTPLMKLRCDEAPGPKSVWVSQYRSDDFESTHLGEAWTLFGRVKPSSDR